MTRVHRNVRRLCVLSSLLVASAPLHAQEELRIEQPPGKFLPAAPLVIVRAIGFPAGLPFRVIRLRLSLNAEFQLIIYDSSKVGDAVGFSTVRLLPEKREIFAEASLIDATGRILMTSVRSLGQTGPRLELVAPDGQTAVTVTSRQPQFVWRSAATTVPPGPWIYELRVTNVARGEVDARTGILDTAFTYPDTLQSNTSYRWKVIARLANGFGSDSAVASSASSFVVFPTNAAIATLLYQNFPNPFPATSSQTTCFWFDLRISSHVELTILDLRGHLVKTMIPGTLPTQLDPGRYGRLNALNSSGCDPALSWDGTANNGRVVPAGVYLLRFKADGEAETVKKILFLGR